MRESIGAYRTATTVMLSVFTNVLAETELRAGHRDLARAALATATTLSEETGETFWMADIRRVTGDLLICASPPDFVAGEQCYHEALAIAREQGALSLELRAAMSLARFWHQQARHAEARELLAPIYDRFTEGFDTADLKEAKALLDELA